MCGTWARTVAPHGDTGPRVAESSTKLGTPGGRSEPAAAPKREGAENADSAQHARHNIALAKQKNGHRDGDPDDLLAIRGPDGIDLRWLSGERIPGGRAHGTGCALSSAIAAGLAVGKSLRQSVDEGRGFVASSLRAAEEVGSGARFLVYS